MPKAGIFQTLILLGVGVTVSVSVASAWEVVSSAPLPAVGPRDHPRLLVEHPPQSLGIEFVHSLSRQARYANRVLLIGAGLLVMDLDQDGLNDILLLKAEGENELYKNLGGWRFQSIPKAGGLAMAVDLSCGVTAGDVDANGTPDLIISTLNRGAQLFLNQGKMNFLSVPDAGFVQREGATSGAMIDWDHDGDLDFYQGHYRGNSIKDQLDILAGIQADGQGQWIIPDTLKNRLVPTRNLDGRPILLELGEPDSLYMNNGHGRFREIPFLDYFRQSDGSQLDSIPRDWTLSVKFHDFNQDGYSDLYSCSDFLSPDRCWLGQPDGTFRELPWPWLKRTSYSSMDADFADLDGDGLEDLFVVDMLATRRQDRLRQRANMGPNSWMDWAMAFKPQVMRNTLFQNSGNSRWTERAWMAGLAASDWSWTTHLEDVDLDGLPDILIGNGTPHDVQDSDALNSMQRSNDSQRGTNPADFPPQTVPNRAFRNLGNFRFDDVASHWGFDSQAYSQSMALGDLDGDGDRDIVINNLDGPPQIYENTSDAPRILVHLDPGIWPGSLSGLRLKLSSRHGTTSQVTDLSSGYLSQSALAITLAHPGGQAQLELFTSSGDPLLHVNDVAPMTQWTIQLKEFPERIDRKHSPTDSPGMTKIIPDGSVPDLMPSREVPVDFLTDYSIVDLLRGCSGDVLANEKSDGFLVPAPENGLHLWSVHSSPSHSFFWQKSDFRCLEDWPSNPEYCRILKLHAPDDFECLVTGKLGNNSTWIWFLRCLGASLIPTQAFEWTGKTSGPPICSTFTAPDAIQRVMIPALSEVHGGGNGLIQFSRNPAPDSRWIWDAQWSEILSRPLNLAGAAYFSFPEYNALTHKNHKVTHMISAWHRGPVDVWKFHEDGRPEKMSALSESLRSSYGMWTSVTPLGSEPPAFLVGNFGVNSPYSESLPMRWVSAWRDHTQILTLPVSHHALGGHFIVDFEVLSEVLPGLSRHFPTRTLFGEASWKDLLTPYPGIHTAEESWEVQTLHTSLVRWDGQEWTIAPLPEAFQVAPVRSAATLPVQDNVDWIFVGQNLSSHRSDREPMDAGSGVAASLMDSQLRILPVKDTGYFMPSEVTDLLAGRWIPHSSMSLLAIRNGRSPVIWVPTESAGSPAGLQK